MKKETHNHPTAAKFSVLRQVCNLIPNQLVPKLAREQGAKTTPAPSRTGAMSWRCSMPSSPIAWASNDGCDAPRLHSGPLSAIRGATPPSRNGFSNANKVRPAAIGEEIFWKVLRHLEALWRGFAQGQDRRRLNRFKRKIMSSMPPSSNWSPPLWIGPNIAGGRPRPSVTCAWTCKVSTGIPSRLIGLSQALNLGAVRTVL